MKNVQIVDGAANCAFSIYAIPEFEFQQLFPGNSQNVEFIEDAIHRLGENAVSKIMKLTWNGPLNKVEVNGIHGTLFVGLPERRVLYPNKREADLDDAEIQRNVKYRPS